MISVLMPLSFTKNGDRNSDKPVYVNLITTLKQMLTQIIIADQYDAVFSVTFRPALISSQSSAVD